MSVEFDASASRKNFFLSADMPGGSIAAKIECSELEPSTLFDFGARANPKRSFLFLSKVLGKHLPVRPDVMCDIHRRIAGCIPNLPEPIVFVGMAETATGLGQGVFEAWLTHRLESRCVFIHTTRYRAARAEAFEFEEPHSHAPRVFLHVPRSGPARSHFLSARSLVLIDDEISTGATFANLSNACVNLVPSIRRVHLACITDFLGAQRRAELEENFGVPTSSSAILKGEWSFEPSGYCLMPAAPAQCRAGAEVVVEDGGFGRLGRTTLLAVPSSVVQSFHRKGLCGLPNLVLGTGEFMHAALVLGRSLQELGEEVLVQSTTRSPILPWGQISSTMSFADNYGEGIANYLYGVLRSQYGQIIICCETDRKGVLRDLARKLHARLIRFKTETLIEESSFC